MVALRDRCLQMLLYVRIVGGSDVKQDGLRR